VVKFGGKEFSDEFVATKNTSPFEQQFLLKIASITEIKLHFLLDK